MPRLPRRAAAAPVAVACEAAITGKSLAASFLEGLFKALGAIVIYGLVIYLVIVFFKKDKHDRKKKRLEQQAGAQASSGDVRIWDGLGDGYNQVTVTNGGPGPGAPSPNDPNDGTDTGADTDADLSLAITSALAARGAVPAVLTRMTAEP